MPTHDHCPRYPSLAQCGLRYNLSDSERENDEELHQTEPNVPPIGDKEYGRITRAITPVIEKHNQQYGYTDEGTDYYYLMGDQFRGDRTIEVTVYGKAAYTREFVSALQLLLRRTLRLWRILLVANVRDDLILVYPDTVRNNDAVPGESLADTLVRVNAHSQAWQRLFHRYLASAAPGYRQPMEPPRLCEMKVAYNAASEEVDSNLPRFNTIANPPELTTDEYLDMEKDLVPVLERYGPVVTKSDVSDLTKEKLNSLWLIRTTAMQWDRTRILVRYGTQQFTPELISGIQGVLQRWPLWRVALDAEDEHEARFIYPNMIH